MLFKNYKVQTSDLSKKKTGGRHQQDPDESPTAFPVVGRRGTGLLLDIMSGSEDQDRAGHRKGQNKKIGEGRWGSSV